MEVLKTPILGDTKYGRKVLANMGKGLHLHARAIEIMSPKSGKTVRVEAELPSHMKETFQLLGFDAKSQKRTFEFLGKEYK